MSFNTPDISWAGMQSAARKLFCDPIGCRIEVVVGQHVHRDAPIGCKDCSNGPAGPLVKLFVKRKAWRPDIDGNAVELDCALEQKRAKIRHDAGHPGRQREESSGDRETDGIETHAV